MELYRSHVLVCGGTGCTSSGSAKLIERFEEQLKEKGLDFLVKAFLLQLLLEALNQLRRAG